MPQLVNWEWYPTDTSTYKVRVTDLTPAGSGGIVLNSNFETIGDGLAAFVSHQSATNPHNIGASDVGYTTAQWNASQLQGNGITDDTPALGDVLRYDGSNWAPSELDAIWSLSEDDSPMLGGNLDVYNSDDTTTYKIYNSIAGGRIVVEPGTNGQFQLDSYGNTRGTCAIDLQIDVGTIDKVADGNYSSIVGGKDNKITTNGTYSFIGGGHYNYINQPYASVCGTAGYAYNSGQHVFGCDREYGVGYRDGTVQNKEYGYAQSSITNNVISSPNSDSEYGIGETHYVSSGCTYNIPTNTTSRVIIQCLAVHCSGVADFVPEHVGYWSITGIICNTGQAFWINGDTSPSTSGPLAANVMSSGSPPSLLVDLVDETMTVTLSGGGSPHFRSVVNIDGLDVFHKNLDV